MYYNIYLQILQISEDILGNKKISYIGNLKILCLKLIGTFLWKYQVF